MRFNLLTAVAAVLLASHPAVAYNNGNSSGGGGNGNGHFGGSGGGITPQDSPYPTNSVIHYFPSYSTGISSLYGAGTFCDTTAFYSNYTLSGSIGTGGNGIVGWNIPTYGSSNTFSVSNFSRADIFTCGGSATSIGENPCPTCSVPADQSSTMSMVVQTMEDGYYHIAAGSSNLGNGAGYNYRHYYSLPVPGGLTNPYFNPSISPGATAIKVAYLFYGNVSSIQFMEVAVLNQSTSVVVLGQYVSGANEGNVTCQTGSTADAHFNFEP